MATALPLNVVLQSKYNGKYLEYVKEGSAQGYVRFSGEDVHSPLSKFQVERESSCNSSLVHLLCRYNNKYLVPSAHKSGDYVVPVADKPEEDRSQYSCTLFDPISYAGGDYRFKHVNSRKYAVLWRAAGGDADPKNNCLYSGWVDVNQDLCDVCTVIDSSSLVVLPKHVTFKGDNGCYLWAMYQEGHRYLQFSSYDAGDERVAHEVFHAPDGSIRLKSKEFDQFWRLSPNWIWGDSSDTSTNDKDTLFWPVKVNDNTIALRSMGNGRLCQRLSADGKINCLNAAATSVCQEAQLQVAELVLSREIYNVRYHLDRARRYNEQLKTMGTQVASNESDKENTTDVVVSLTETRSSTWSASVSLKLGVKAKLQAGVPLVASEEIEVSAEVEGAYQWGIGNTTSSTIGGTYHVVVPPMSKATVTFVGTTANCDVPFSYTQTDTHMDGTQHTYNMDDGMYTGVNSFNITYHSHYEPLN